MMEGRSEVSKYLTSKKDFEDYAEQLVNKRLGKGKGKGFITSEEEEALLQKMKNFADSAENDVDHKNIIETIANWRKSFPDVYERYQEDTKNMSMEKVA